MIRREYFPPKFNFVLSCQLLHEVTVTEGNVLADTESFFLALLCHLFFSQYRTMRGKRGQAERMKLCSDYVLLSRVQHRGVGILGAFLRNLRLRNATGAS